MLRRVNFNNDKPEPGSRVNCELAYFFAPHVQDKAGTADRVNAFHPMTPGSSNEYLYDYLKFVWNASTMLMRIDPINAFQILNHYSAS